MVGRTHRPDLPAARAGGPARHAGAGGRGADPARHRQGHRLHACAPARCSGVAGLMGSGRSETGAHPVRPRPVSQPARSRSTASRSTQPTPQAAMDARHRLPDRGPPRRGPDDGRRRSPTTSPCPRCRASPPAGAGCSSARGWATTSSAIGRDVQVNARDFVAHAGQEPLRRQPAEGRDRQVAAARPAPVHPRRADPRHRRRRQVRGLQDHQPPRRRRRRRADDLLGDRGADRDVRPHPGDGPRRDPRRVRPRAVRPRGHPARARCGTASRGAAA